MFKKVLKVLLIWARLPLNSSPKMFKECCTLNGSHVHLQLKLGIHLKLKYMANRQICRSSCRSYTTCRMHEVQSTINLSYTQNQSRTIRISSNLHGSTLPPTFTDQKEKSLPILMVSLVQGYMYI